MASQLAVTFRDSRRRLKETRKLLATKVTEQYERVGKAFRPLRRRLQPVTTAATEVAHTVLDPVAEVVGKAGAAAAHQVSELAKDHLPDLATLKRIFNLWDDYYKNVDNMGYVRSDVLGVFSLFSFSHQDAKLFLLALEKVDTRFTQTINVHSFAEYYCPQYIETLIFLWRSFHALYRTVLKGGGGDKGALTAGTIEIDCGVDIKRPSYLHFSAFLLLIMTVGDTELQKLLYWMWFYQPKRAPKVANLLWYYGSIWGEYSAEEKKEYDLRKSKLETSLALQTMKEFGYRAFQISDWKAGGAWTTPLRKLRTQLLSSFVTEEFWKRLAPMTVNVVNDVHSAINRLNDASLVIPRCIMDLKQEVEEALAAEAAKKKPNQNANQNGNQSPEPGSRTGTAGSNEGGTAFDESNENDIASRPSTSSFSPAKKSKEIQELKQNLDKYWKHVDKRMDGRKIARKELRMFLRVFRGFREMPVDSFGDDFGDDPALTQFLKLAYRGAKKVVSSMGEFLWELKMAMRYEDIEEEEEESDYDSDDDDDELNAFLDEVSVEEDDETSSLVQAESQEDSDTKGHESTLPGLGGGIDEQAIDDTSVIMPVDPEIKFKAALKVPAQMLHNMAGTARARVMAMMSDDLEAPIKREKRPSSRSNRESGSERASQRSEGGRRSFLSRGSKESRHSRASIYSRASKASGHEQQLIEDIEAEDGGLRVEEDGSKTKLEEGETAEEFDLEEDEGNVNYVRDYNVAEQSPDQSGKNSADGKKKKKKKDSKKDKPHTPPP